MVIYGRSDEEWDLLADAGLAFLVERARLAKLTSYTELSASLERWIGLPGLISATPMSQRQWVTCRT